MDDQDSVKSCTGKAEKKPDTSRSPGAGKKRKISSSMPPILSPPNLDSIDDTKKNNKIAKIETEDIAATQTLGDVQPKIVKNEDGNLHKKRSAENVRGQDNVFDSHVSKKPKLSNEDSSIVLEKKSMLSSKSDVERAKRVRKRTKFLIQAVLDQVSSLVVVSRL